MIPPQYRFHGTGDNTSHYLGPKCNNNSCGAPEPNSKGMKSPSIGRVKKKMI